MRLRAGRTLINLIDFNLMVTIHLRMKVARMIGRYKIDHDLPTFVPAREAAVIESRLRLAKVFRLDTERTKQLFEFLMSWSRKVQEELRRD